MEFSRFIGPGNGLTFWTYVSPLIVGAELSSRKDGEEHRKGGQERRPNGGHLSHTP